MADWGMTSLVSRLNSYWLGSKPTTNGAQAARPCILQQGKWRKADNKNIIMMSLFLLLLRLVGLFSTPQHTGVL
jgi:hypothetical protein